MRYYWYIASIPTINTWFPTGAPTFSTSTPCPKIRVPPNQALRCELFCQKSRLSRRPEAPIFGKISRCRQNPEARIFGKISWFRQNPKVPIFRKICHFRKFLNRQISGKIRGFVRNFRKIWDFWPNCRMYWSNSGYNCRVSDRGAHFFGRRSVLCNNNIYIYKYNTNIYNIL